MMEKVNSGAKKGVAQVIAFPGRVLKPLLDYLKKEEDRLIKAKKALFKEDPFSDNSRDDDNSVDSDVAEQVDHERASALRQQISRSLVSVRKTMTRIKLGKYGICERCGKMIDTDRLAIKPTAEYCVKCEQKIEEKVTIRG